MTHIDDIAENAPEDGQENLPKNLPENLNETDLDEALMDEPLEPLKKPRKKYGKFALGATALSALVIGGASGGGFVQYIMAPLSSNFGSATPSQSVDLAPLETQITRLADENAKLKTRLSKLDAAFDDLQQSVEDAAQNIQTPAVKVVDVSGLKARLDVLEGAPKPTPINEAMLGRLEKLQAAGSPALDLSAIDARLAELETASDSEDLSETLQTGLQALYEQQTETDVKVEGQIAALSDDLKSVEDGLSETQIRLGELSDNQTVVGAGDLALIPAEVSSLPFPKQALLAALAAQMQKKPLFKRALSKHIKVKDPSAPAVIIGGIETDFAAGNLASAAERFDSLPPEIRSAGRLWRDSLK